MSVGHSKFNCFEVILDEVSLCRGNYLFNALFHDLKREKVRLFDELAQKNNV